MTRCARCKRVSFDDHWTTIGGVTGGTILCPECARQEIERLQAANKDLHAIVDKLGTMEDGTPIAPDTEAWFPHPDGGVKFHRVGVNLVEEQVCHGDTGRGVRFIWQDCYGDWAAAQAASDAPGEPS